MARVALRLVRNAYTGFTRISFVQEWSVSPVSFHTCHLEVVGSILSIQELPKLRKGVLLFALLARPWTGQKAIQWTSTQVDGQKATSFSDQNNSSLYLW